MSFTLAIVGRPNVGKSTLFNRLVGRRLALVDDQPGVTRDLREGDARLGDLRFVVIDSAGLELAEDDSLQGRMRRLTERAVEEAEGNAGAAGALEAWNLGLGEPIALSAEHGQGLDDLYDALQPLADGFAAK